MALQPFHLALPVDSIENARDFYISLLECPIMYEEENFLAFDFFGHYLALREHDFKLQEVPFAAFELNNVTAMVPSRHFGLVVNKTTFNNLLKIFKDNNIYFFCEPIIAQEGSPEEVGFMTVRDYNGYGLEFKYFIFEEGEIVKPEITNNLMADKV